MDPEDLERKLGVRFRNRRLMLQALTHRSFLNENRDWPVPHNERLEFLGDAVIELMITERLFKTHANKDEGELTRMRSNAVDTTNLSGIGQKLDLFEHLYMSRGERNSNNRASVARITACAVEAIIGALYLDQGYAATKDFVERLFYRSIEEAGISKIDSKSVLQVKAQELLQVTPYYKVIEESGPDHAKRFVVGAYFGETLVGKGHGPSKKYAEEKAAEAALILKGWMMSPAA